MRILFLFGTRPEAIKMAPLIKEFSKHESFQNIVCVTGQHREMLDQVLEFFKIVPDYDFNLMTKNQSLITLTSRILVELEKVIDAETPDLIFVQGDTTTVLAGALGGAYKSIPVAHLEAGLRTGDKSSPFPEEINRVLTGHVSQWHFVPTDRPAENLRKESITQNVYKVGNTVIDALLLGLSLIKNESEQIHQEVFPFLDLTQRTILVTGHRRESFGEPFFRVCAALRRLASEFSDVQFVYPVHLNPNVRQVVMKELGDISNIHLIEPLNYKHIIWLMNQSYLVMTDSGGIQEEAPTLGKPVVVMREVTERQEGVDAGTAKLVGTDDEKIYKVTRKLLVDESAYSQMANAVNPYGDGTTSQQIAKILKENFSCQ